MRSKINKILLVGKSLCSDEVAKSLEEASHQNSVQVSFFDRSDIAAEEVFDSNINSSQEYKELTGRDVQIGDDQEIVSIPPDQQLATALIQEHEHRNRESSLFFHDKLHANHMLLSLVQSYLNENKIDSVVFFRRPENLIEVIVYQVAEALDLSLLILHQSIFNGKFFSYRMLSDIGNFSTNPERKFQDIQAEDDDILLNGCSEMPSSCQVTNQGGVLRVIRFLLRVRSFRIFDPLYIFRRARHLHDAPLQIENWRDEFAKFFYCSRTAYFEFFTSEYDEKLTNQRFVYFPLQTLSNLNSEILINRFSDQLLAIEQLSKLLPTDCKIVVKGNFNSEPDYLTPMFFHRIKRISNVVRVPSYVSSMHLIERCEFLATVNSSQGWDALTCGKKVLTFGNSWYRNLPGVILYHKDVQYSNSFSSSFEQSDLNSKLWELLSRTHTGVLLPNSDHKTLKFHTKDNAELVANTIYDLVFERVDTTFCKSS